jgi:hypothetical protein
MSASQRSPLTPHPLGRLGGGVQARTDTGPIEAGTIQRAAEQLDLMLAMSEVYRSDPSFAAPDEVWARVKAACPDFPTMTSPRSTGSCLIPSTRG